MLCYVHVTPIVKNSPRRLITSLIQSSTVCHKVNRVWETRRKYLPHLYNSVKSDGYIGGYWAIGDSAGVVDTVCCWAAVIV